MKKFKIISFSMLLLMLICGLGVGCKSPQPTTRVVHDSIYVEKNITVTLHDTLIKTEAAKVSILYPCDSLLKPNLKPIEKAFKNAKLTLERQGNYLKIDCNCDTLAIKAQLKSTIEKEVLTRDRTEIETLIKDVKFIPFIVKILAWIGGGSVCLVLLYIGYKLFNPIRT